MRDLHSLPLSYHLSGVHKHHNDKKLMNDAVCHILRNNEITVRQLQVTLRVEMVTIGEDKTMCLYICKHDVYDSKTSKKYIHFEKQVISYPWISICNGNCKQGLSLFKIHDLPIEIHTF